MNTENKTENGVREPETRKWQDIHFVLNKTQQERDKAEAQRDELLEACIVAQKYIAQGGSKADQRHAHSVLFTAIASAQKGAGQ